MRFRPIVILVFLMSVSFNALALTFSAGEGNVAHQIGAAILLKAYQRIGFVPEFVYMPLQESLDSSDAGYTDGEIIRIENITTKYPNLMIVPVAINYVEAIAFSKDGAIKIDSWSDLKPYKVAIAKGAIFIEDGTEGMDRVMTKSFNEAFELLLQDKVDIVVTPKTTGLYIIHKQHYNEIKIVSSVLQKVNLYHFLHKKNAYLIPRLTPVLESMRESGELSFIRSTYLNTLLGL